MNAPDKAAALAHYSAMAAEAAQAAPTVKESLTVAQLVAYAEQLLAHHRSLAAGFVAKADAAAGQKECIQHATCVDTVRGYVAEVNGLIGLCRSVDAHAAADRITVLAEATTQTLIDEAYRCRMLSLHRCAAADAGVPA